MNGKNKPKISPPGLIEAMTGGFDAVANHIYLIIFPLAIDLLLWLGPRVKLSRLIHTVMTNFNDIAVESGAYNNSPDMKEMVSVTTQIWDMIAERANLLTTLRTYPVGIPSLMAARLPIDSPLGYSGGIEVGFGQFFSLWFIFTLVGLLLGTLYYLLTAQIIEKDGAGWVEGLRDLPRAFQEVIWLTIFLIIFLVCISIPAALFFSIIVAIAGGIGQWIILFLSGALLWLLMPLVFSAHGIFVNRAKMFPSLLRCIRLTHLTLPRTSMFILVGFVLIQGLNLVWQIPPENSWLSLVGILGHGFVFTGLLAASFLYYKRADLWFEELINLQRSAQNQAAVNHVNQANQ
jgi:hypothetical protein